MGHAVEASTMATCDRKHVGAVAVIEKRILAVGFNGAPSEAPHCDDVGHELININGRESCIRAIHAEINIVGQAAKFGVSIQGSTVYVNTFPCYNCFNCLVGAGVKKIFYKDDYPNALNQQTLNLSRLLNIPVIKL
jgi:dCMP deaminase